MSELNYLDMMEEAAAESADKTLTFTAKDGEVVTLSALDTLSRADLKLVTKLIDILNDDKVSTDVKLNTIDQILGAVADKKDSLDESLEDMPLKARMKIFEAWMGKADAGNS